MRTSGFILISKSLKTIGAGLACSGLIGAGVGIGLVFASLLKSYAINPKLKTQLFSYALLGFALSEAVGLLALMMACIILYA
jgi:F-type H+-transporting ATPase subunit c